MSDAVARRRRSRVENSALRNDHIDLGAATTGKAGRWRALTWEAWYQGGLQSGAGPGGAETQDTSAVGGARAPVAREGAEGPYGRRAAPTRR